ncbi:phage holin [Caldanaerobacter sp.]|uniref:phage holin n=1 Tax=Caldanaerobacter sp. TaxID=2930036 RepID=UPI003C77D32C
MSELWYNVLYNLLLLIVTLAAAYLVAFLKKKVGAEKLKQIEIELETKQELAAIAVQFVEQVYRDVLKGEEKYNKAAEWLVNQFKKLGLEFTDAEVKGLIEAAVRAFKDTFGEEWAKQTE